MVKNMQHCEIVNNDQKEAPQCEIAKANDQQNAPRCEIAKASCQKSCNNCEIVKTGFKKTAAMRNFNDE